MDDVAIPADVENAGEGEEGDEFYAVPQRAPPPSFYWPNNSNLAADHIAAGSFNTASRLLRDQLGIISIDAYKPLFMSFYARFVNIILYHTINFLRAILKDLL